MELTTWLDLLRSEVAQTDLLQWTILVLGVAEVLLAKSNNILLYPAGIAATALSVFVLFQSQLFAESLLNIYYVAMSVYGWWYWIKKKDRPAVAVTRAGKNDWVVTISITAGSGILLAFVLKNFTPSTVPVWDAWVSATAWAGMWLLAKRKVENWVLLNVSNAFAIPLLFRKQLPLFALLTIVLFVVACFGYVDWRKAAKRIQAAGWRNNQPSLPQ
jgi:nicotinamide mononucleotide transporter